MKNTPGVINHIVKNDLCIGCGLCTYQCPTKAIDMKWNELGFLIPELTGHCDLKGDCLTVCPFNPFPDKEVATEDHLAELFLKEAAFHHPKMGRFQGIYAGYANEFRLSSSSGGIATYVLTKLLEKGIVNNVFSVKESTKTGTHYEYSISHTKQELLEASQTKYFPVTLSSVFSKMEELEGKVAIVGVGCFIKAIRLAQHTNPSLKEKIPFLVGIICGGVKSRFFTEYLAGKANVSTANIQKPQFRIKDVNSEASDYSFGCYDTHHNEERKIKMRSVGDMWGTGLFKANACDFCDDVTTELADISVGDAWLEPYLKDGKGTNVVVTRSAIAQKIIAEGMDLKQLNLDILSRDKFLSSQQGSFNHRHIGLPFRTQRALKRGLIVPPKRFTKNQRIPFSFKLVQICRMKTRSKSLETWKRAGDAAIFDQMMKKNLSLLGKATLLYHFHRRFISKLKSTVN